MNIGMLGHKDFPSRSGGIEVVVGEMAPRLAKRGVKVSVYNRGRTEKAPKHMVIDDVDVYPCFTVKKEGLNALVASITATLKAIHEAGKLIIAEGVESADQAKTVTEMGIDYAQGYHYFGTMLPENCREFLREYSGESVEG